MEHIKNLLNPTTQKSGNHSKPEPKKLDDRVTTRLFGALHALYGHKWSSLIVDDDMLNTMMNAWGHTLADIEPQTIKTVMDKLPMEYPNWPPTVGQFLELCKVGKEPAMRPQLPKPRGNEQIALDALAEMKRILR